MHVALVVTGAPLARRAGDVVDALAAAGHHVTVCLTDAARDWVGDIPTGLLLAGRIRPDVVLACPATFNTLCKWAAGINDTAALGVLNDALGLPARILAVPMVADRLTAHPAWPRTHVALQQAGVTYLDPATGGTGLVPAGILSGTGERVTDGFDPAWLTDWLEAAWPNIS